MQADDLIELTNRLPQFIRTLRLFPGAPAAFAALLAEQGVRVVQDDASIHSPVDAIFVFHDPQDDSWLPAFRDALRAAPPEVYCAIFPQPLDPSNVATALQALGLEAYPARRPRDLSRYTLISIHQKSEDPLLGLGHFYVRKGYDPFAHAQTFVQAGHPDGAFDVLDSVPEARLTDPVQELLLALEKQYTLLMRQLSSPDRLRAFFLGQREFYRILNLRPQMPTAYITQAEAWRSIGRPDMAHRMLSSVQAHWPDPAVEQRLEQLGPRPRIEFPEPPGYPPCPPEFRPRLLLLNHVNSDVGFDALYDGLCSVIGPEKTIEFPWKAYLHGKPIDDSIHHPAMCNHPGAPQSVEVLEAQLRENKFDAIIYADTFQLSDVQELDRLLNANTAIPVILLDQQDEGWDNAPRICRQLNRAKIIGQFKREMLQGQTYAPRTVPLPLTYMDGRAAPEFRRERSHDLFWAGHRHFGLRRLYLEALENSLGIDLGERLAPEEYAARLDASRIGLDLYGFGYDTIRYWELPAHGCLLLAERKPLVIPNDFQPGKHAVCFDTLQELEEQLAYYTSHPREASEIAEAGYRHFHQYHTASQRARQFLGQMNGWLRDQNNP